MRKRLLATLFLLASSAAFAQSADRDRRFVMDSLRAYSPDGFAVVDTYVRRFPEDADFMVYWDGGTEGDRWCSINTIVHELAHGYMARTAGYGALNYYLSAGESILVTLSEVFRSQEMAPGIPASLRTFRFETYVDSSEAQLGSQSQGAYGLLDEMAAYYIGTKASFDMLPAFKAKGASADWPAFFQSVDSSLYGILEFRFFVLRYIQFARERHADVYRGIMANAGFRKAFSRLDDTAARFVSAYFAAREGVFEAMRSQGYTVSEDKELVWLEKGGKSTAFGHFLDVYELLLTEMARPEDANLARELYGSLTIAAYPARGSVAASAAPSGVVMGPVVERTSEARSPGYQATPPATPAPASPTAPAPSAAAPASAAAAPAASPSRSQGGQAQGGQAPSAYAAPPAASAPAGTGAFKPFTLRAKDKSGDVESSFVDILSCELSVEAGRLVLSIALRGLPERLPFGARALKADRIEYSWSLGVDLEGDGDLEYELAVQAWKKAGAKPEMATMAAKCQVGLWKYARDSATMLEAEASFERRKGFLVITLADSEAFPIGTLSPGAVFTVLTVHDQGERSSRDELVLR